MTWSCIESLSIVRDTSTSQLLFMIVYTVVLYC